MISLVYFFIFLFGLALGSFLNCVIYRLERGESFLEGRSYCPHCQHILNWSDLIPLFSFLILKGKCRYCQKKISLQYPLVELATGILFVLTAYNLQLTIYNLQDLFVVSYLLLVVNCLLVIFVYDLKHYIIPDKIIYPAIAVAFLYQIISNSAERQKFCVYATLENKGACGTTAYFVASYKGSGTVCDTAPTNLECGL